MATKLMSSALTLVLITADPNHPIAEHAYRYVKALLTLNKSMASDNEPTASINIFFYGDAAHTANQLRWQVADRINLMNKWQQLHLENNLRLPVCVSTALTRGISDEDNAKRHQLPTANLAQGFELVGLGELAAKLNAADKVIQF